MMSHPWGSVPAATLVLLVGMVNVLERTTSPKSLADVPTLNLPEYVPLDADTDWTLRMLTFAVEAETNVALSVPMFPVDAETVTAFNVVRLATEAETSVALTCGDDTSVVAISLGTLKSEVRDWTVESAMETNESIRSE